MKFPKWIFASVAVLCSAAAIAQAPPVDGEEIVILTHKSADPFSTRQPKIAYATPAVSEAEAVRANRKRWKVTSPVPQAQAPMYLITDFGPLMTRRKHVEETLTGYEAKGGIKRDIRVDHLAPGK